MIPKSGNRFSEKIMHHQSLGRDDDSVIPHKTWSGTMVDLKHKHAAAYWIRKCLAFVAAGLLAALAITQWAHSTRFARQAAATDGVVAAGLMAKGGQFEHPPLW